MNDQAQSRFADPASIRAPSKKRAMKAVTEFRGEYRFLSNFYPCPITLDGIIYQTVEHAYQASKSLNPAEREIIECADWPGEAKKLGGPTGPLTLRDDWEQLKVDIMLGLLRQKFKQSDFKDWLLATGEVELVEGNYWGDREWGVCKGEGKNLLGKLLMQVREELRHG